MDYGKAWQWCSGSPCRSQNEAMVQNNEIHDNVVCGGVNRFKWRRNRDNCHSIISFEEVKMNQEGESIQRNVGVYAMTRAKLRRPQIDKIQNLQSDPHEYAFGWSECAKSHSVRLRCIEQPNCHLSFLRGSEEERKKMEGVST